ncbi:TRAP transporter substrate-binding protein [Sporosarcina sp. FSL W7-1349]|uniref:TRAP transporter substrate-binding protein n=1 Tax=Sporosarcina sp. FSL W7-1349 TaxID=2921561 RepID=UPI0030FB58BA
MKAPSIKKKSLLLCIAMATSMMLAACSSDDPKAEAGTDTGAGSASTIALDLSHVWPPSHGQETVTVKELIADVEEATNGQVKITSYPGASLAASDGQFDAAATGAIDIGFSVNSYNPNQFPLTSVMELPFMSDQGEKGAKVLWQLYEEFPEFEEEYTGTVPLWLFTSDPGQIFTVGKPVKSLEDLKGMRIRSPSAETNEWLTAIGATPVSMPMNETYEALERGVVDGTIAPWEALLGHSLIDVINYATVGNFYSTTFYATMNENTWDSLGEENQTAIRELTGEKLSMKAAALHDQSGRDAVEQAKEKGVEIYELSEEELDEWKVLINPTIEKWIEKVEGRGLPGQAIYDRAVELSAQ